MIPTTKETPKKNTNKQLHLPLLQQLSPQPSPLLKGWLWFWLKWVWWVIGGNGDVELVMVVVAVVVIVVMVLTDFVRVEFMFVVGVL